MFYKNKYDTVFYIIKFIKIYLIFMLIFYYFMVNNDVIYYFIIYFITKLYRIIQKYFGNLLQINLNLYTTS